MASEHKRALKTFHGKLGLIRKGMIFRPDPNYAKALERNGLIEDATEEDARKAIIGGRQQHVPGPGEKREDKSIPAPPFTKTPPPGKGRPGPQPKPGTAQDAGKGQQSSVSRPGQASPEKTLTTPDAGGKRARRKRVTKTPPPAPADDE